MLCVYIYIYIFIEREIVSSEMFGLATVGLASSPVSLDLRALALAYTSELHRTLIVWRISVTITISITVINVDINIDITSIVIVIIITCGCMKYCPNRCRSFAPPHARVPTSARVLYLDSDSDGAKFQPGRMPYSTIVYYGTLHYTNTILLILILNYCSTARTRQTCDAKLRFVCSVKVRAPGYVCVYIYIYIYMYVNIDVYIIVYIYIYRERERYVNVDVDIVLT